MATIPQGSVLFLNYDQPDAQVRALIVGGGAGGGGGTLTGGGGGGGRVIDTMFPMGLGAYAVVIGPGGAGGGTGVAGTASSFNGQTAQGGSPGANGGANSAAGTVTGGGGGDDGSGGGTAGAGTVHTGGDGGSNAGGGGAGAGADGSPGGFSTGGQGGAGVDSDLSGTLGGLAYGGGGGGAGLTTGGVGGNGGGGAGATGVGVGTAGTVNRGGGGGGGRFGNIGGAGGSGVVIIRYRNGQLTATGGVITTADGYTIHTFTASGTFTVTASVDYADRAGTRLAINKSSGVLLSSCPSMAYMQQSGANPEVLALDNGTFFFMVSNVGQVYLAAGTRLAVKNYLIDIPPSTLNSAVMRLGGTDHSTKFYFWANYNNPVTPVFTRYLVAGDLSASTALASTTRAVDNVTSDGAGLTPELFGIGVSAAGVLFYIKSNNVSVPAATHTLKRFDLPGNAPLADTIAYGAAVAYPVSGFINRDGTPVCLFSDGTVKHLNPATGAVLHSYTVSGTVSALFAGVADTRLWVRDASVTNPFRELNQATGATTDHPALEQGYTLKAIEPIFIAQAAFTGCTTPPPAGETRYIRRLRRFALPFDRSFWVYISRIEFLIQSGVGVTTGQGSDPIIQVRFSGDGGETWFPWIQVSAGQIGQRYLRPVVNRIGKLRNGVCEVAVSDPVLWYFLACFIDADEGG